MQRYNFTLKPFDTKLFQNYFYNSILIVLTQFGHRMIFTTYRRSETIQQVIFSIFISSDEEKILKTSDQITFIPSTFETRHYL